MKLKTYLKHYQQLLRKAAVQFLKQQSAAAKAIDFPVLDRLEKYCTRGKMVRGVLVVMGYQIYLGKVSLKEKSELPAGVLQAALAVELNHSALLIQDDIMDQDQTRRGQSAFHIQAQGYAQQLKIDNSSLYGRSVAVCASDLLFFWAFELMQSAVRQVFSNKTAYCGESVQSWPNDSSSVFINYCSRIVDTVWGQMDDVHLAAVGQAQNLEAVMNVYRLKSARYTLVNPLLIGAGLAGIDCSQKKLLEIFAENLGIIFQIRDDQLGLTSQKETLGKTVGIDVADNKQTIFRYLLYSAASQEEIEQLDKIFGGGEVASSELETVLELMEKHDVFTQVEAQVKALETECYQNLNKLNVSKVAKDLLEQLMVYLKQRKS